ncbi:MAG: PmbA/TldA family metallopeptidase, partial [Candidatus Limnocylindrales bacterium]
MHDLSQRALDTAVQRGAAFADVRLVRRAEEAIAVKSGRVEAVSLGESEGFGVRVLVDGAWGFAASNRLTAEEADRVAAEAVRIARASATALRERVRLDDRPAARGSYRTPVLEDPFALPIEEKVDDLLAADAVMRAVPGIAFSEARYDALREWKTYAASDGSLVEQELTHVGAGIEANAVKGDELQRRSYPDSAQAAGYEWV